MGEIPTEIKSEWINLYKWPQISQVHIDWAHGALEEMKKEAKAAHKKRAGLRLVVNR